MELTKTMNNICQDFNGIHIHIGIFVTESVSDIIVTYHGFYISNKTYFLWFYMELLINTKKIF